MVRKNPFIVGGPRLLAVLILYVVLVAGGAVLGATLERGSPVRIAGYGYLERAGLPAMAWGIWVHPLVFLFWAFAWMVVVRRYR
jgi:hypothetical protein